MSKSAIYCEGSSDKTFWGAWLEFLECTNPYRNQKDKFVRMFGADAAEKGHHVFHSKSDQNIHIVPCGGKNQLRGLVTTRLTQISVKPLDYLVINVDPDTSATDTTSKITGITQRDVLALANEVVKNVDGTATEETNGDIVVTIENSVTKVALVRWEP